MSTTSRAPRVGVKEFKRTKILATVGPATDSYDSILGLIKAGANGIRLNFSHGTHEDHEKMAKWVRKAAKEYGKPVAVLQDLQGPKMRLGDFDGVIPVEKGQSLRFKYKTDYKRSGIIPTQYDLSKKVKRGERIFLYDGKVQVTVTSVKESIVYVRVDNSGVLLKRKGMNLPDTDLSGEVITKKDKEDLAFGSYLGVDYVAQSFVQSGEDIKQLRRMLKALNSPAKIIAKIETVLALKNIDSIIEESDAIMVARGDLAVETAPEVVPVEQRRIVGLCRRQSKPVIIATQMLVTMTEADEPTRAEVSDVATAVVIGADCVMLSEETATGKHPKKVVQTMKKIIKYTEQNSPVDAVFKQPPREKSKQSAICSAVVSLAEDVCATAIVAETKSGSTAIQIAARRSSEPLLAVTSQEVVANQLALVYGIKSYVRPDSKQAATKLTNWLTQNSALKKGDIIVTASGEYPGVVGTTDTIKVRVL
ncbi:MAG: pyruvate kinase [Candidatus Saccharimonadales bacterium]|jgi:pyruvate kinase